MLSKPNSQRTNMSKKVLENISGIGKMFNRFLSTIKHGIAKLLYNVLRLPKMDTLSYDVLNFTLRLRTIIYWKYRG